MKINTKVRYGLRAMIEIAEKDNLTGILQKEIAEKQDIPLNYLDSIISGLRGAGLIINAGGKGSGYLIAKASENISVYDIYRAFEADLTLVQCSCDTNECLRSDYCPAKDYWFMLNKTIKDTMKATTLYQLLENKK